MLGIQEKIKEPKEENLKTIFITLQQNLIKSPKAQSYLKERSLKTAEEEIGYNYNTIKELKSCIIFPLKDKEGQIVSLYGRSINNKNGKHYYLHNRQGLYPHYPCSKVETIILTESIIDALTIKQNTNYEVLALYGTNGLTNEHIQAIISLKDLKEIIFFLDGDESGETSVKKYSKSLNQLYPEITISQVEPPEKEDPNSLIQSHEAEILLHLIEKRKKVFGKIEEKAELQDCHKLNTENPNYLKYKAKNIQIIILGGINLYPIDKLKVTLKLEKTDSYTLQTSSIRRKKMEKREIKIRGIQSRAKKNPYLSLTKTPNINLRGKWLILKGFRAGEKLTMEIEYEKITLRPKKEKESQPKWE